uniref:L-glutamate gamma-semialdehyde dehydrogenase n=1 Tax=Meloidogyne hapla TaxID=6305 RepID=A0A1I8BUK8_MELHA
MILSLMCRRSVSTFGGLTSEQFMKSPLNEPVLTYLKGSQERKALEAELDNLSQNAVQVPLVIGGNKLFRKEGSRKQIMPFNHTNTIAHFNYATAEDIEEAIKSAMGAREAWERKPLKERADIFLHAADLCAGKYRMRLNAATMLGQAKNIQQAEIAVLSNYIAFEALLEAGIPPGVISFLPSDGPTFGNTICANRHLAGINFTGSMPTFLYLYNSVAKNMGKYVTFPRLVGECGGKNFHFVHSSANIDIVVPCTLRAAYEYQGQKCSACSRFFVPKSLWPKIKDGLINLANQVKIGDVRDGSIFMSAVIDDKAFKRIKSYIDYAKNGNDGMEIIYGGKCDDSKGYFVQPTIIEVKDVNSKLLTEEIFGPVLAVYVYPDDESFKYLKSLKNSTPYGLTGAVFGEDKQFLETAKDVLRDAVGNLYLNDKCTGAVVGQQPFGGARQSGTNDKAGGLHYLLRWTSPQTIKETTSPQTEWRYPNMD